MKITLDTNVLLSSTFWYGDSARIIAKIETKKAELVLSEEIIKEFSEVLEYDEIKDKIKNKNLEMIRTVEEITELSTIVQPKDKLDIIKQDPDDNTILECAVEGKVDYIVSQDRHLLNLKEFRGIKIVNPHEMIEILNKG